MDVGGVDSLSTAYNERIGIERIDKHALTDAKELSISQLITSAIRPVPNGHLWLREVHLSLRRI